MTRLSPFRLCLSFTLLLSVLGSAVGCAERYGFRKPPPSLLRVPANAQSQQRWPTAVPAGAANPVRQAGHTQAQNGVAGAIAPAAFNAPAMPRQEPPPEIALAQGMARVEALGQLAQQKASEMNCCVVRLRKREVVNGSALPEDTALMKFRSQPFSVYIKALEESPTAGREILFVNGRHNDMLQIRTGKGDILSGIRLELSPTAPRATASSRRTVLEAGFPNIVARFVAAVQEERASQAGLLQPLGPQARRESPSPMECVKQIVPPGKEKHLPLGGVRFWHFAVDPRSADYGLPMLICTYDERQREVEYYAHDRLVLNCELTDEDFDPIRLWAGR